MSNTDLINHPDAVAVIGISGRFPGAKNVPEFWQNLCNGVESIVFFSDEELEAEGIDSALRSDPNYVNAKGILENVDLFDASFFGFNAREAEILDPQHRLFLECAWEALEDAGYDPESYNDAIGVYAGAGINSYKFNNLMQNPDIHRSVGDFQIMIGNDAGFLPTRVSYKLNLRGPSVNIQTACSTSLVAVHFACQGLLEGQCDIALAGGVSVRFPHKAGHLYKEGMILSPDGHCRAFDERAQGIVNGEGVGIVVLKRLADALEDRDHIYAVVRGSAINNDGSMKIGYTAPSVRGQAEAIAMAQAIAGVDPETITCVETHGTGTTLGDPVEIAALTEVFRASTDRKGFCAIGSVKTNVGHLDPAAGVASLIKTVLALQHKQIPPSLHFTKPNPKLDLDNSPFFVNTKLTEWQTDGFPRRAGVSSLGIGGTNIHVVLEEAPVVEPSSSRPWHLLLLSAKTAAALDTATQNMAAHLGQHPHLNLADVSYTLQVGRRAFEHRRFLVCQDVADAVASLETMNPQRVRSAVREVETAPVFFMFSGQGAQYVNMGLDLYEEEPLFREQIDYCVRLLEPMLGLDLREILYPPETEIEKAAEQLKQTAMTQPALFVIEYALARLLMAWGVQPQAMIGHSIGEYVAACLAGVFSLEEALALVVARGRLMQDLPEGTMLVVHLPQAQVELLLNENLSLAAINGPSLCVVSGPAEAVDVLQDQLAERDVDFRRLHTSHAFHSQMIDPMLEPFTRVVQDVNLAAPQIPYISCVSGTWITVEEATDPAYWARHCRQPVRFSQALQKLISQQDPILLEVGPGSTLCSLAKQQPARSAAQTILPSLRHPKHDQSDQAFFLNVLGQLWLAGVQIDWTAFYAGEQRHRTPLPTYPFERKRYWIEPVKENQSGILPDLEPALESQIELHEEKAKTMPVPDVVDNSQPAYRKDRILSQLRTILSDVVGLDLSDLDPSANFFDLGLDSLALIQVGHMIQNEFNLRIQFHQLLNDLALLEDLVAYLDQTLPPDALPPSALSEPVPAAVATEVPDIESVDELEASFIPSTIPERVIYQQLKVMSQQLELLRRSALNGLENQKKQRPRTRTELLLAVVWIDILEVEQVGTDDDFFGLGGTSLQVSQLRTRLQDTFGVKIPLEKLYRASTISKLSHVVEEAKSGLDLVETDVKIDSKDYCF